MAMRTTHIVRRIDDLGRVIIPREIRKQMGIKDNEPLEIYTDKEKKAICFVKYTIDPLNPAELFEQFERLEASMQHEILKTLIEIHEATC